MNVQQSNWTFYTLYFEKNLTTPGHRPTNSHTMNTQDVSPTMNYVSCINTPPRAHSPLACPNAPRRRRQASAADENECEFAVPPRILIPTLDSHRGRGILAGDFIKPDPTAPQQERRAHILRELEHWLVTSMRLQTHAREVEYNCLPNLEDEVATGTWPAARLCLVADRGNFGRIADPTERYHTAATWAYWVCYNYLTDGTPSASANEELALGFITTDRLADGATIEDLWNWSPTHRLRCDTQSVGYHTDNLRYAPPLPDSDSEDEHPTADEEEEDEIETDVCLQRVRIEGPIWAFAAIALAITFYLWLVAFLIDGLRH